MTNRLAHGEAVLWTGVSGPVPPAERRRILLTQLAVILVVAGVLTVYAGWSLHWGSLRWFLIILVVLAALRCVAYVVRRRESLTRGRYTVTNLRVYVDGQALGFPVRRSEKLADLKPATLWRDESVSFGDPARPSDAGRYDLVPIKRLVLYRIDQPQYVLELLRQVQPPMIG